MSFAVFLDYAAVIVFALTGALAASRAQLDSVGFAFVACLTAVGGGTIRDLLLARENVFWVAEPTYILVATLAAITVFFAGHLFESRYRALLWLDSIALAVAVAAGVGIALAEGEGPIIVVLMGMITGTLGGLMRDVVCNEVPLVLKQGEIYVTAAFAGACAAVAIHSAEIENQWVLLICALVTWALRAGSMRFGWRMPTYKSRPPRQE